MNKPSLLSTKDTMDMLASLKEIFSEETTLFDLIVWITENNAKSSPAHLIASCGLALSLVVLALGGAIGIEIRLVLMAWR